MTTLLFKRYDAYLYSFHIFILSLYLQYTNIKFFESLESLLLYMYMKMRCIIVSNEKYLETKLRILRYIY